MRGFLTRASGFALATSILFPAMAAAQDAPEVAEPTPVGLEEIVVTARKRPERIQDAPISITAFTADAIAKTGATDIGDIAVRTPGLQYGNYGDQKLSPLSLRGIVGGSASAGSDPAVGIYVDEVFVGNGAGASLDLFDIERVEVLRGPQGTLYGRNTIAGVINVTTRRPSSTPDFRAEASYGSFDAVRLGASASGPIVPDLIAAKISGVWHSRGGTSHNVTLDRDINTQKSWFTRGQLLITPSPATEILLTGEYREVDQEQLGFETLSYSEDAILPALLDQFGLPRNEDPYDRRVYMDIVPEERLKLWGVSAILKTRIGKVDVTNVTAYRDHDYFSRTDTDRSPLRLLYDGDPESVWRLSEELRFGFSTGPLQWILGGYYFRQHTNNQSFVEIGPDMADAFGDPSISGLQIGSQAQLDTTSYALFGNVDWDIARRLTLSLGSRYTIEKKSIDYTQSDPLGLLGGDFAVKDKDSWKQFTPSVNLRYRFTDDVLAYATVSKGFKSGGFNDALGEASDISFAPEITWNYEAGLKTQAFDRRLTANFAAFLMKWGNIQLSVDNPATPDLYDPIFINGGKAHSLGFEGDIQGRVTNALTLGLNFSIQEAEYEEGTTPNGEPLRRIPHAPSYTSNINAEYRVPLGATELSFYGEALLRGSSYLTLDNHPDGRVNEYALINGRIALASGDGGWEVALMGSNLTNRTVKQRLFDLTGSDWVGQKFISLNEPRTFSVQVRTRF